MKSVWNDTVQLQINRLLNYHQKPEKLVLERLMEEWFELQEKKASV